MFLCNMLIENFKSFLKYTTRKVLKVSYDGNRMYVSRGEKASQ